MIMGYQVTVVYLGKPGFSMQIDYTKSWYFNICVLHVVLCGPVIAWTLTGSPMRVSYGVSFVRSKSAPYLTYGIVMLHDISCYDIPCY